MVFLFKWQKGGNKAANDFPVDQNADHVFFAKQEINNACATQAILSILLNRDDLDIGEELKQFKEFTADFPPDVCNLNRMTERPRLTKSLDERLCYFE